MNSELTNNRVCRFNVNTKDIKRVESKNRKIRFYIVKL